MTKTLSLSLASLLLTTPGLAFAQGAAPTPPPETAPAPMPPSTTPAAAAPEPAPPPPPMPPPPAPPPPPASKGGSPIELMSLSLMRDKGIISQAEYDSAVQALSESVGTHAAQHHEGTAVLGKWATTFYGFVEPDIIADTTRSFFDLAGAGQVARSNTQNGDQGRTTMAIRNSRFGFRLKAPEVGDNVRASAQLEFDFIGLPNQLIAPSAGGALAGGTTEAGVFSNSILRVRHMNFKVETPVVDILFGQYWSLFGWQPLFNPNTVQIQGVPGELFSRTPQLRISKTIKANPVTLELAVAAVRPVQRDNAVPDGQAGIRFALDSWQGTQTIGGAGTQLSPLSIAATGLLRQVRLNSPANPHATDNDTLSAFAVDGFIPILPASKEDKGNSLSIHGEFTTGYGDADQFTGLTGGVGFAAAPTTYVANIDSGVVGFFPGDLNTIHGVQWQTYIIGGQYYFPGMNGKLFVSGNYSHIESNNIQKFATSVANTAALTKAEDWFDANLFVDPTPAVRLGLEYSNFNTQYVDGQHAINHRVQLSGWYIF